VRISKQHRPGKDGAAFYEIKYFERISLIYFCILPNGNLSVSIKITTEQTVVFVEEW